MKVIDVRLVIPNDDEEPSHVIRNLMVDHDFLGAVPLVNDNGFLIPDMEKADVFVPDVAGLTGSEHARRIVQVTTALATGR